MNYLTKFALALLPCFLLSCEDTHAVKMTPLKKPADLSAHNAQAAKKLVDEGKILFKEYPPLPSPPGHGEYLQLLRQRCKADQQIVKDTDLDAKDQEKLRLLVQEWNEIMNTELEKKFGPGIRDKLIKEGEEKWKEQSKANKKKGP